MRALLVAVALCLPAAASDGWLTDLAAARRAAADSKRPILVDFQAVWCYSCYYMEEKVLSKDAFKEAAEGLVLLKLDVDTPEGGELKKKLRVGFLPSYVLMDASERELGRVIGEQTEKDFLTQLARIASGAAGTPAQRLGALLDANDFAAAEALRAELGKAKPSGPEWARASARLDLALAVKAKRHASALESFASLMLLGGGCELPYHLFKVSDALAAAEPARRRSVLEAARGALVPLAEARWFGPADARCADGRSVVESVASVYEGLGASAERKAFLDRAADELAKRLAATGAGNDRNLDDDARYAFQLAGRAAALEAHLRVLVDAYPSDYVYAARLARFLSEAGRGAEALPLSEKAYHLSYGANRPGVAKLRAELLAAAGRAEDAKALLRLELKAAQARFPDSAPPLEALLKKLGG
jgi:thiol-disulfide isomerase/thioredoxin